MSIKSIHHASNNILIVDQGDNLWISGNNTSRKTGYGTNTGYHIQPIKIDIKLNNEEIKQFVVLKDFTAILTTKGALYVSNYIKKNESRNYMPVPCMQAETHSIDIDKIKQCILNSKDQDVNIKTEIGKFENPNYDNLVDNHELYIFGREGHVENQEIREQGFTLLANDIDYICNHAVFIIFKNKDNFFYFSYNTGCSFERIEYVLQTNGKLMYHMLKFPIEGNLITPVIHNEITQYYYANHNGYHYVMFQSSEKMHYLRHHFLIMKRFTTDLNIDQTNIRVLGANIFVIHNNLAYKYFNYNRKLVPLSLNPAKQMVKCQSFSGISSYFFQYDDGLYYMNPFDKKLSKLREFHSLDSYALEYRIVLGNLVCAIIDKENEKRYQFINNFMYFNIHGLDIYNISPTSIVWFDTIKEIKKESKEETKEATNEVIEKVMKESEEAIDENKKVVFILTFEITIKTHLVPIDVYSNIMDSFGNQDEKWIEKRVLYYCDEIPEDIVSIEHNWGNVFITLKTTNNSYYYLGIDYIVDNGVRKQTSYMPMNCQSDNQEKKLINTKGFVKLELKETKLESPIIKELIDYKLERIPQQQYHPSYNRSINVVFQQDEHHSRHEHKFDKMINLMSSIQGLNNYRYYIEEDKILAQGIGVQRSIGDEIIKHIHSTYLIKHNVLTEFNYELLTTKSQIWLRSFGQLLHTCILDRLAGLSYHLPLEFLQAIAEIDFKESDLEYFLQLEDPIVAENVMKVKSDVNNYEYKSYMDLLLDKTHFKTNKKILDPIVKGFLMKQNIKHLTELNYPTLAYYMSGETKIDREQLLKQITTHNTIETINLPETEPETESEDHLKEKLKEIIAELPEEKLKIFLCNISGCGIVLSDAKYIIQIKDELDNIDFKFTTCTTTLVINSKKYGTEEEVIQLIEDITQPINSLKDFIDIGNSMNVLSNNNCRI